MEETPMKIFKISRHGALCYIIDDSGTDISFEMPSNATKEDIDLFRDLCRAYNDLPGGFYDFFCFCTNYHSTHEAEARKFVEWLRANRDWEFDAEYICPYTNEEVWRLAKEDNVRV